MFSELFAPLMDGGIRNAQLTSDVRHGLATGLRQSHRLPLKLGHIGLLCVLHVLSRRVANLLSTSPLPVRQRGTALDTEPRAFALLITSDFVS